MTLALTVTLLVLGATPDVALPLVDSGVTVLPTCRIAAIAFRTEREGWMSDRCGGVFRSLDGGFSWQIATTEREQFFGPSSDPSGEATQYVQRIHWLDESIGLAFVYGRQLVWRTQNGGRTWSQVALPSADPAGEFSFAVSEMLYAVESAGGRVWVCGSTGTVTRSLDAGRTWQRTERLFESALPIGNATDWCSGLSFLNENDGWAAGWRTLWKTTDGGLTWSPLPPIVQPADSDDRSKRVLSIVRLSQEVAWAQVGAEVFRRATNAGP